jgi:hypothetical protein
VPVISAAQVPALSPGQVPDLSPVQVPNVAPAQAPDLSPAQIACHNAPPVTPLPANTSSFYTAIYNLEVEWCGYNATDAQNMANAVLADPTQWMARSCAFIIVNAAMSNTLGSTNVTESESVIYTKFASHSGPTNCVCPFSCTNVTAWGTALLATTITNAFSSSSCSSIAPSTIQTLADNMLSTTYNIQSWVNYCKYPTFYSSTSSFASYNNATLSSCLYDNGIRTPLESLCYNTLSLLGIASWS